MRLEHIPLGGRRPTVWTHKIVERHWQVSTIITSNREPTEMVTTMASRSLARRKQAQRYITGIRQRGSTALGDTPMSRLCRLGLRPFEQLYAGLRTCRRLLAFLLAEQGGFSAESTVNDGRRSALVTDS